MFLQQRRRPVAQRRGVGIFTPEPVSLQKVRKSWMLRMQGLSQIFVGLFDGLRMRSMPRGNHQRSDLARSFFHRALSILPHDNALVQRTCNAAEALAEERPRIRVCQSNMVRFWVYWRLPRLLSIVNSICLWPPATEQFWPFQNASQKGASGLGPLSRIVVGALRTLEVRRQGGQKGGVDGEDLGSKVHLRLPNSLRAAFS